MDREIADLEQVMVDGWPALETDRLGDWLLRASAGFSARGNSVLTTGEPGLALPQAVRVARQWYAARGLPARFCLVTDVAGAPFAGALPALLLADGLTADTPTLTLTAAARDLPALRAELPGVTVDAALTLPWLTAFAAYRPIRPGVTEGVLTGSAGQLFLSLPGGPAGRPRAIARMSIAPGWAGIHGMWVDPEHRRQGLATALVATIAHLAKDHHMPRVYLQVPRSEEGARAAYAALGFTAHHGHVYLAE